MSLDFVRERHGAARIELAKRQQKQLSHFTQSSVQEEVSQKYFEEFAQRNYSTADYFLNWTKTVFRSKNFLSFYKHLRFPLPSAKLINDEVKPQLKRVYFADDSYFRYTVKGQQVEAPQELSSKDFEERIFNAILFNHNAVIIHDLNDVNSPYRNIISIDDVVAVDSEHGKIKRIAYNAEIYDDNGNEIHGFAYMDDAQYIFYDKDYRPIKTEPHDLGICPACWVSNEAFDSKCDIVRRSVFSYVREELEEYVFLKTLLRMAELAGALPVTVKLKDTEKNADGSDAKGLAGEPTSNNLMGSQKATLTKSVSGNDSVMQAGTVVEAPRIKDKDGKIDMSVVRDYLKFYHFPVESLDYMKKRVAEVERSIIANVLGDYAQNNDAAKNADQIYSSLTNRQDKLRSLAMNLSWVRNQSDYITLALKYGSGAVNVSCFYGSDFFLDSETELYDLFAKVPNQIERRNLLMRIGKTKYRFNKERAEREKILYSLIPFVSDKDFSEAVKNGIIDNPTKALQLRFDYWIAQFEANYGDILLFWENMDGTPSEKLIAINTLLLQIVTFVDNSVNNLN